MSEQKAEQEHVLDIKSRTQKTYTVTIGGAGPRPVPYTQWIYRPTRAVVVKRDGNVVSVELSGPRVKKDGADGSQSASERLHSPKDWPAWVKSLVGGLA